VDRSRAAGLDHGVGIRVLTVDRNGLCRQMFGRSGETRRPARGGSAIDPKVVESQGPGVLIPGEWVGAR